ncbi:protein fem-1 homolog C [Anopheles funestus]|uniref:protein fem-1 homolog C n=1 Tax=Anopheles funestus TaxID=62324 RepID=UPI0020C5D966|nr:protein fem-1 homolog C [Anopheles funestus]XP_049277865.1 protein fem-1 homolog C [Anopheles funestus]XP_049277866.1 protein fem-1 homolog C [Anopheles funestus]
MGKLTTNPSHSTTSSSSASSSSKQVYQHRTLEQIGNELVQECKACTDNSRLSKGLRERLERLPRKMRKEVVKRPSDGCSPLFIACRRGNVHITEYLITVCEADSEQKGMYEVPEDRSIHCVTPLWCACVSGKLPVVKCLVRLGSNINALSDTGSTPLRSACFMTHIDIVQFLVEHGADIKKPNYNGGTCLINSVQSVTLCTYLISKGADVNARDIQNKTALHYAIQEHRLETAQLLLEHGADPFAKSHYGDDALQTACLKGAYHIFDYLKKRINYSAERLADAHELFGSTLIDDLNVTRGAVLHWRLAHQIRLREAEYIPKKPAMESRAAYGYASEFTTIPELDNIAADMDAMRVQSLLIYERILGIDHRDTLFRLMFRGASYADAHRFQRCIDLWLLALQVRVQKYSILYSDTCLTAQALVRLMLDLIDGYDEMMPVELYEGSVPRFEDVYAVFSILTANIAVARQLITIRPVHRKQQENFDRVMKCLTHLMYLMLATAKTDADRNAIYKSVHTLVHSKVRSAITNDTLLHLSVSRLNVIKSGYFSDDSALLRIVFPSLNVAKLLLDCGADVNAKNESNSTPLLVAAMPYNYDRDVIHTLLEYGAHLDEPNRQDDRPLNLIRNNPINDIPTLNYLPLKCLCSTVIVRFGIPYRNQIPRTLEEFVKRHEPY